MATPDGYGFQPEDTRSPAEKARQERMLAEAQARSSGSSRELYDAAREAEHKGKLGAWWSGELNRRIAMFRANPTVQDRLEAMVSVLQDYRQAVADGDIEPQSY